MGKYNRFPKKRFGQHFLQDQSVIQRLVEVISPTRDQNVVEIGPGTGALTTHILKLVKKLNVIELDRDLIPVLKMNCEAIGDLVIHTADVLKFDFNSLKTDKRKLRIVGNLPYNISSPLLFHLFQCAGIIEDMHFMLQKEVADRLSATAGTSSYGRLSIMAQYFCYIESLFDVMPESFEPKPKVNSSVIRLVPHQTLPFKANNFDLFGDVVKKAFSMRRKQLQNSLKSLMTADQLIKIGINPTLRPEQISIEGYVNIANSLMNHRG